MQIVISENWEVKGQDLSLAAKANLGFPLKSPDHEPPT